MRIKILNYENFYYKNLILWVLTASRACGD